MYKNGPSLKALVEFSQLYKLESESANGSVISRIQNIIDNKFLQSGSNFKESLQCKNFTLSIFYADITKNAYLAQKVLKADGNVHPLDPKAEAVQEFKELVRIASQTELMYAISSNAVGLYLDTLLDLSTKKGTPGFKLVQHMFRSYKRRD